MGHRDRMTFQPNPDGRMEFSRATKHKEGLQGEGTAYGKPQSMT